jgi:acyl-CoA hydrolase
LSAEPITTVEECVDKIIKDLNKDIVFGMPLGIGKPTQFINELYRRAKADPSIKLRMITALSLVPPKPGKGLESTFLNPVFDRIFDGYVPPEYAYDLNAQTLPPNVQVSEFFVKSGSMMKNDYAQQHYISCNYTHVARCMIDQGVNLLAQQVSAGTHNGQEMLSLSSNTDVTNDLMPLIREEQEHGRTIKIVAQVNQELPFMKNDALVTPDEFDYVVDNISYYTTLFAPPNMPVSPVDFAIGMHASSLIKDDGTLQIGIGSMGDAIAYCCILRHQHNDVFRESLGQLGYKNYQAFAEKLGDLAPFEKGLYGSSEMFVNGFLHLMKNGILKRKVYDDVHIQTLVNEGRLDQDITPDTLDQLIELGFFGEVLHGALIEKAKHFGVFNDKVTWENHSLHIDGKAFGTSIFDIETITSLKALGLGDKLKHGIAMHGGFFLGPTDFYQALREMSDEQRDTISMTSVGHVNQLYINEDLAKQQRQEARFINTGLMATVNGAVVSDGLENGKIVSGVGGQYNFVSMAHALPNARSILLVRSTRSSNGETHSNIVYNYGHITIPRHLRDVVITEYGVANLRGRTDAEVIKEMLNVADSRFQEQLLNQAKANGKVEQSYEIPAAYRNNTPDKITRVINEHRKQNLFPAMPFGTDFSPEELKIGAALKQLKPLMGNKVALAKAIFKAHTQTFDSDTMTPYLERMKMTEPQGFKENLEAKLLQYALDKVL